MLLLAAKRRLPNATAEELELATAAWGAGLAPTTQQVYGSRFRQFIDFCWQPTPQLQPLPASTESVDLFLLHLARQGTVAAPTLAQASSAINTVHVLLGYEPPVPQQSASSRLLRAGLTRLVKPLNDKKDRLPLLAETMFKIVLLGTDTFNGSVVRDVVAVCMSFLFMLRGSTVAALKYADVSLNKVDNQTLIRVTARVIKNETEPAHWTFYTAGCPEVAALFHRYFRLRAGIFGSYQPSSMWHWDNSSQSEFSSSDLQLMLHRCLRRIGFSDDQLLLYLTHSGRIGAASAMNAAGVPHEVIRIWGKWKGLDMLDTYVRSVPASPRNAYFFGWMLALPPTFR